MTTTEISIVIGLVVNVVAIIIAILRVGHAIGKFETIGAQQAMEIKELKLATAKLGDVIKDLAVQSNRQDNIETRQLVLERHMDELRRGDGFILPLPGIRGSQI